MANARDRLSFEASKLINKGFRGGGRPVNIRTKAVGEERIRQTVPKKRPIIGAKKAKVDGTQTGNLAEGVSSVADKLRKRKRQLESVGR